MARSLHADVVTETTAAAVRLAYLVDLAIDSGTLRMWTGIGPLVYGGNTYSGVGNLGAVGAVEESADIKANGIRLGLSGVASSLISIVLGEQLQGRTARVYLAFFNSSWVMVGDPVPVFTGRIDVPDITDAGSSCEIGLSVENRLIDFDRPGEVRYFTDQDQQRLFSGDIGLQFVEAMQDKPIWWGRPQPGASNPTPVVNNGGSGGGGAPVGGFPDQAPDGGPAYGDGWGAPAPDRPDPTASPDWDPYT